MRTMPGDGEGVYSKVVFGGKKKIKDAMTKKVGREPEKQERGH